ncbi:MAG: hypothetical protein JXB47_06370 [Anaerolineae bacterium]|nr:hypothetical protein [Anaerolineae bacterium]
MHERRRFWRRAGPLFGVVVGLALYRRVIALPFFHDDVMVLRALSQQSLADIWWSSPLLPYYRPLSYLPWKLMQAASGRADPFLAHVLVLSIHLVNTALVGALARRLAPPARRDAAGALAALLFAVFPFSYQVVAWTSAIPHVLVTLGMLGAVLAALRWRRTGQARLMLAVWAGAFLATFAHENGVLALPFVMAALCVGGAPEKGRRGSAARLVLPVAAMAAWYVVGWLSAPKTTAGPSLSIESAAQNLAYFSQGLAHPVSMPGGALVRQGANDLTAALGLGVLGIVILVAALWRRRGMWALLWYALALGPSALLLGFHYVVDAPRLMYLPSVGAALAWACALAGPDNAGRRRVWGGVSAAALIALAGAWFVTGRMALYGRMDSFYDAVNRFAAREPAGPAVSLNTPAWIAYHDSVYALGHEGVAFLADYMTPGDFIWANTGAELEVTAVRVGALVHPTSYWVGYQGAEVDFDWLQVRAPAYYQMVAVDDAMTLYAAWHETTPAGEPLAVFDNGMTLVGGGLDDGYVILHWRAAQPVDETVFVHALCDGARVAQADGPPLDWGSAAWREVRQLVLPPGVGRACLRVYVGLYDAANGARSAAHDAAGAPFPDDAALLP